MDAVEFIVTRDRMCRSFNNRCRGCEIANRMDGNESCNDYIKRCPAEAVAIVEKWGKEHPLKTRQNEFLKLFPRVEKAADGMVAFCPEDMDSKLVCPIKNGGYRDQCIGCREKYWLEEVDE